MTWRRCSSCTPSSVVAAPITSTPRARRYSTASAWVLDRLPVETTRAPPWASVSSSATVLGSRWIPVPMVRPSNGRVRLNSAAIEPSSRQPLRTHSIRDIPAAPPIPGPPPPPAMPAVTGTTGRPGPRP